MVGAAYTNSSNEESGAKDTRETSRLEWKDQAVAFLNLRRSEAEGLIRKHPLATLLTGLSLGGLITLRRQR